MLCHERSKVNTFVHRTFVSSGSHYETVFVLRSTYTCVPAHLHVYHSMYCICFMNAAGTLYVCMPSRHGAVFFKMLVTWPRFVTIVMWHGLHMTSQTFIPLQWGYANASNYTSNMIGSYHLSFLLPSSFRLHDVTADICMLHTWLAMP